MAVQWSTTPHDSIVHNPVDEFSIEQNAGPHWFWQYYNGKTDAYENYTKTSSPDYVGYRNGKRWVLPNRWDQTLVDADSTDSNIEFGNSQNKTLIYLTPGVFPDGETYKNEDHYFACITYVADKHAIASITNDGEFRGDAGGTRGAKIIKNGEQVWPKTSWSITTGWNKFDFPKEGVSTEVSPGDKIHFVIGRVTANYGGMTALWNPIINLKVPFEYCRCFCLCS